MKAAFLASALALVSVCAALSDYEAQQCGPSAGYRRCKDDKCCSQYGWCGRSTSYCGTGCQWGFGRCTDEDDTPALPSASPSKPANSKPSPSPVSRDGRCGSKFGGQTCQGSVYGNCCSQYDWCGKTDNHCKTGCQSGFGTCFPLGGSSSKTVSSTKSTSRASSSSTKVQTSSAISTSSSKSSSASVSSSKSTGSSSASQALSSSSLLSTSAASSTPIITISTLSSSLSSAGPSASSSQSSSQSASSATPTPTPTLSASVSSSPSPSSSSASLDSTAPASTSSVPVVIINPKIIKTGDPVVFSTPDAQVSSTPAASSSSVPVVIINPKFIKTGDPEVFSTPDPLASPTPAATPSSSSSIVPVITPSSTLINSGSAGIISTPAPSSSAAAEAFQNDPLASPNAVSVSKSDNVQQAVVNDPAGARPGGSSSYLKFTVSDDKAASLQVDTQPSVQSGNTYSVSVWVKSTISGSQCSVSIVIDGTTIGGSGTSIPADWTEVTGEYDAQSGASPTLSLVVTCAATRIQESKFRARAEGSLGMSDLTMWRADAMSRASSRRAARTRSARYGGFPASAKSTFVTSVSQVQSSSTSTFDPNDDITHLPPMTSLSSMAKSAPRTSLSTSSATSTASS